MSNCSDVIEQLIADNADPGPVVFEQPNCQGTFFPSAITNTWNVTYSSSTIKPSFDKIRSVWVPSNAEMLITKDQWSILIEPQIIENTETSIVWANRPWGTTDPDVTEDPPILNWADIDTFKFNRVSADSRELVEDQNMSGLIVPLVITAVVLILILLAMFI